MKHWKKSVPVYVTNETADGYVFTLNMNVLATLLLFVLIVLNAFMWGIFGIVKWFELVF